MASRADVLRARADAQGRGRGRVIGGPIRREMVEYTSERVNEGASPSAIARELGISPATLKRWTDRPAFVQVAMRDDASERSGYVVVAACGVRVEGLSLADVAELLRRLS